MVLFCVFLFLSLFFFQLVTLWHLNGNPLRPRTLFISGHLLLLPPLILLHLTSSSMMIKPIRTFQRTFHDAAFIRNAKSFYQTYRQSNLKKKKKFHSRNSSSWNLSTIQGTWVPWTRVPLENFQGKLEFYIETRF